MGLFQWGGCQQAAGGEGDVIQADVTLWTWADFALKDHLKVSAVAQRDLLHLPVVALISRQVEQWVKAAAAAAAPPQHTEGADAITRHVKVETHLQSRKSRKIFKKNTEKRRTCQGCCYVPLPLFFQLVLVPFNFLPYRGTLFP